MRHTTKSEVRGSQYSEAAPKRTPVRPKEDSPDLSRLQLFEGRQRSTSRQGSVVLEAAEQVRDALSDVIHSVSFAVKQVGFAVRGQEPVSTAGLRASLTAANEQLDDVIRNGHNVDPQERLVAVSLQNQIELFTLNLDLLAPAGELDRRDAASLLEPAINVKAEINMLLVKLTPPARPALH